MFSLRQIEARQKRIARRREGRRERHSLRLLLRLLVLHLARRPA